MRICIALILVLVSTTTAIAHDTGNAMPPKPATAYPPNIPDPVRQGGDTIEDATVIPSIPYSDTGTTSGYTNDYDEACPFPGSTAPDVVFSYTPLVTEAVTIDLCGSGYDTKLYVYDADLNLVACNDDAYFGEPCGVYVSALECVLLQGGTTYDIVIDGYGSAHGDYLLSVEEFVPCVLEWPAGGVAEGEPPLVDGYVDNWNGGCNTPGYPFQDLMGDADGNLVLCGVSGWYMVNGYNYRDTDWYLLYAGPSGAVQATADAEQPTYFREISSHDCAALPIAQQIVAGDCLPASMTMPGYPAGPLIWFWGGPTVYIAPSGVDNEYDYVVWFSGLEPGPVATASTTWGTIKALYE